MKTKRRHELQTNILADWLGKKLEPVMAYWKVMLAAVIVVAGVCIVIAFISQQKPASENWPDFLKAEFKANAEDRQKDLIAVGEDQNSEVSGVVAMLRVAALMRNQASFRLSSNRAEESKNLEEAKKLYQRVLTSSYAQLPFQLRARYGLGLTCELLGELEEAQKNYRQVSKDAKGTLLGLEAQRHLDKLVDPDTNKLRPSMAALYKAIDDYDPSDYEPLPERPSLIYPGSLASVHGDPLPDRPSLNYPGSMDGDPLPDRPSLKFPGSTDGEEKKHTGDDPAPKPPAKKTEKKPALPKDDPSQGGDK